MKKLLLPLLLLAGCAPSLRTYEVGELEEERVQKAMKAIAAGIESRDAALCVSCFVPDYSDPAFDPWKATVSVAPDGVVLTTYAPAGPDGLRAMNLEGMQKTWAEYIAGWKVVSRALAKIRRVTVDETGLAATGRFYLDVYGLSAGGEAREDCIHLETSLVKKADRWWITGLRYDLPFYGTMGARAQFRNVSVEANAAWPHEPHPEARGYLPIPEQTADCGLACGDYDGDGLYDVYLCNGRSNRLLRNKGDGTFEDVTEKAGVADIQGESRGALLADFDNDGHPDLYVSNNRTPCSLFHNNGDGTFTNVTQGSGIEFVGFSTSCTAADYDKDGLLDIYHCNYGNFYEEFPLPPVETGEPNLLFHNLGGMKFEEVGEKAGVDDRGWTLAAAWGDPNNDGWPDILVANDFGDKRIFLNDGEGGFEEASEDTGIIDRNFGMSAAFGDVDNDGDFDIYFSNMYSNTNWIFQRNELLPVPWFLGWLRKDILSTLDEMTRGNTFFINNGDGTFTNATLDTGTVYGQWAWGSEFLDYDADGDLDIYCVNGFISGTDSEDL